MKTEHEINPKNPIAVTKPVTKLKLYSVQLEPNQILCKFNYFAADGTLVTDAIVTIPEVHAKAIYQVNDEHISALKENILATCKTLMGIT